MTDNHQEALDQTETCSAGWAEALPLCLVGAGAMGGACLSSWLNSGINPDDIIVLERSPESARQIEAEYKVTAGTAHNLAEQAKTIVLAVKPQDVRKVLGDLSNHVHRDTLVISLVAGLPTTSIERQVPPGTPVIRVMPNTPALVQEGMAAMSAGAACSAQHEQVASALMNVLGRVLWVPETQQDAVTAVSGSGPAYIFYVVEAMIEAGVLLGLPRGTSTDLVVQTLAGASRMLQQTEEHPTVLREQVSSPAGTTMAALRQLDDHKVRAAFLTAMEAARDRSSELSS